MPGLRLCCGGLCYYLNWNSDTRFHKQLFDLENHKRKQEQKHGKHSVNGQVREIRFLGKIRARFYSSINISYLCALKGTLFSYESKISEMEGNSN